jgi:type I restriction enzyme S subunit
MSKFAEVPIGAHLKLTSGFPFASSQFSNEGFPLIRIRDVLSSRTETYFQGYFPPGYIIKKGDVLIGMDGDFHVVRWNGPDALLNQRVLKVGVHDESVVVLDYLFHWLGPYVRKVNDITAATTVKHLSTRDLIKAKASLPPAPVQRHIATILSTIDTAIEQTEALIEKYQHIKAGLMNDLFTRGVLPNGQLRPPREQAPELYQETAIGWIPMEWEVSGLASKGRAGTSWIRTGPFGSSLKGEHWRIEGHPVITIGALGTGQFIESELLYVGQKDASRLIDFQLKENDVVFSRVADVGRSVVVREAQAGWIMSSNLMRIAVNETLLRPDYLQMQLASDSRVKSQIRASVNSGGRDVANSEVLNRLRFAIPKPNEQDRIIAMSDRLAQRTNAEMQSVSKLQIQKLGLMQDLLTGKVPVKADAEVPEAVGA